MNYVFSTMTADVTYAKYVQSGPDLKSIQHRVVIKGGANVADKFHRTKVGIRTEVSDEDMQMLEQDYLFNLHRKNGFIRIENSKMSERKAAEDMEPKDRSAPKVPSDYEPDKAPTTSGKKK